ncbi:hypothetical protein AVEN_32756-1 [Araneus ventricosus]|uniref:HAT C-terminal dimerisation domain-containing protein n=1 Tax=Araneus ventricosus TaxID=182803 RepID=A0A4Y2CV07_ARAVE|nr:hypothetical protein AVEN_32756-1 [Araneus ventricosus]
MYLSNARSVPLFKQKSKFSIHIISSNCSFLSFFCGTGKDWVRNSVKEEFDGFYVRCIAYLDLWENSFGKTEQFAWVNLTKTNAVDWENTETSAEIINSSLLDVPDMKINNYQLFDEVVLAKEYLQSNWEQWKQEETTRDVNISSQEKWLRLFGHFRENHIAAPNLIKSFEYAFCLPGTSAPVERVFSLMNNA